jgi:hypothetical protein
MNNQPQEVIDMLRNLLALQKETIDANNEMIEAQDKLINELRDARDIDYKLIRNLESQIQILRRES